MRDGQEPDHLLYREVRTTVARLVTGHQGCGAAPVPACPGWTVARLLAHLGEVCRRALATLEGREHVADDVADDDPVSLVDSWAEAAQRAEALLALDPHPLAGIGVMDAFTHELDLRVALGVPHRTDDPVYARVLSVVASGLTRSVQARGLPSFRVEVPDGGAVIGSAEPVAAVRGSRWDVLRALSGRRTEAQIRDLAWTRDPGPWLPAFTRGPFVTPIRAVEARG